MFAYLGSASMSPRPSWEVRGVRRVVDVIRVTYGRFTHNEAPIVTPRSCPHVALANLGRLPAGKYTLELFDADAGEVAVMRRAWVAAGR